MLLAQNSTLIIAGAVRSIAGRSLRNFRLSSMDFKKEQIQYLAELAKLEVSQPEIEVMYGQLSNILNYVGQLNEVTISEVDKFSDPVKNINVWRDDMVAPPVDNARQCILDNAPQQEDGLIKAKPVFHYDK